MFLKENQHCIECGARLVEREIKDEGLVKYCEHCDLFQFNPFSSAVSCVILNPSQDKTLLVKQYGLDFYRLVAGYINKGESAEECLVREIKEELNQEVLSYRYNRSTYFEKTNTLMINFIVTLASEDMSQCNYEIDQADWFDFTQAQQHVRPNSLAERFLRGFLIERKQDGRD